MLVPPNVAIAAGNYARGAQAVDSNAPLLPDQLLRPASVGAFRVVPADRICDRASLHQHIGRGPADEHAAIRTHVIISEHDSVFYLNAVYLRLV